jgi:phage baseplate assembly protein W
MPIIHSTKNINPLDLKKSTRIGLAFPLNEVNMTSGTETTSEQLKTNLLNILLTVKGERLNHPNYGIGLKSQLFEQSIDELSLLEGINTQLAFWIPEIIITEINLQTDVDLHKASITLTYQITLDNSQDTIQINFGGGNGPSTPTGPPAPNNPILGA